MSARTHDTTNQTDVLRVATVMYFTDLGTVCILPEALVARVENVLWPRKFQDGAFSHRFLNKHAAQLVLIAMYVCNVCCEISIYYNM